MYLRNDIIAGVSSVTGDSSHVTNEKIDQMYGKNYQKFSDGDLEKLVRNAMELTQKGGRLTFRHQDGRDIVYELQVLLNANGYRYRAALEGTDYVVRVEGQGYSGNWTGIYVKFYSRADLGSDVGGLYNSFRYNNVLPYYLEDTFHLSLLSQNEDPTATRTYNWNEYNVTYINQALYDWTNLYVHFTYNQTNGQEESHRYYYYNGRDSEMTTHRSQDLLRDNDQYILPYIYDILHDINHD